MRLRNYNLTGLDSHEGFGSLISSGPAGPVGVDLDGDGVQELVAAFACNAGGVSWPAAILVYDHTGRYLGWADPATVEPRWDRMTVESITADPGSSTVKGRAVLAVEGRESASKPRTDTLVVTISDGKVHVRSAKE